MPYSRAASAYTAFTRNEERTSAVAILISSPSEFPIASEYGRAA